MLGTFFLRALELMISTSCSILIQSQIYNPSIDILDLSLCNNGFSCLHLAFKLENEEFSDRRMLKFSNI